MVDIRGFSRAGMFSGMFVGMAAVVGLLGLPAAALAQHSVECDFPADVDFALIDGYCHGVDYGVVMTQHDGHGVKIIAWWFERPAHYQVTVIGDDGHELQMRLNPDRSIHRVVVGDGAIEERYREAIAAVLDRVTPEDADS